MTNWSRNIFCTRVFKPHSNARTISQLFTWWDLGGMSLSRIEISPRVPGSVYRSISPHWPSEIVWMAFSITRTPYWLQRMSTSTAQVVYGVYLFGLYPYSFGPPAVSALRFLDTSWGVNRGISGRKAELYYNGIYLIFNELSPSPFEYFRRTMIRIQIHKDK